MDKENTLSKIMAKTNAKVKTKAKPNIVSEAIHHYHFVMFSKNSSDEFQPKRIFSKPVVVLIGTKATSTKATATIVVMDETVLRPETRL